MHDHVLTLNAGSSSLKFALFAVADASDHGDDAAGDAPDAAAIHDVPVYWGQAQGLGQALARLDIQGPGGLQHSVPLVSAPSAGDKPESSAHTAALDSILQWLSVHAQSARVVAVGHRIVHGGPELAGPVRVDDALIAQLQTLAPLAPLHQVHNLAGVHAARQAFAQVPQVACPDTAFHRSQSELHQRYALPEDCFEQGIRRYGFHGLSYESIATQLRQGRPELAQPDARVVVAHLGNGASLCALRGLRSVATTMGFSPLDGLPMGTRCGRLDAAVVLHLLAQGLGAEAITDLLYRQSGLLGLSGTSSDVRSLTQSDSAAARMALDYFAEHTRREIAGMAAALQGLDALVFTGGIGENAHALRGEIVQGLQWLGCELDEARNRQSGRPSPGGTLISTPTSRVPVYVLATNEEAVIARHTWRMAFAPGDS
ncbi:acetate/propionate family kinase [Limnohabitans sp. DM1]|uniref:acetate/propionate family kinase n=1 Tax=Limnohabitans sp. DM1 TaxID=1597955 RepID=UPI000B7E535E|nr:acetate/propionate family kinase [Limnohabitans sp. DM1]